MKKSIENEISIEAPIEKVWAIFSDFHSYPEWSPTLKHFSGYPQVGKSVKIKLEQPDGPGMAMKPKILKLDEFQELRWKGELIFPGLFDGEHYFKFEAIDEKTTKFIQGENFSGLLVPLFKKMIDGATTNGFILFNQALKKRVEEA
ncbi:SRPBCC family protein [Sphingobacterium hungaricum]